MALASPSSSWLTWPLRALPVVALAGRFPLDDVAYDTCYQSSTHALHLHDYRGVMRMQRREVALAPGTLTLSAARRPTWYDLPAPGYHLCIHFRPPPARRPATRLPLVLPLGPQRDFVAQRMMHIAQLLAAARGDESDLAHAAASAAMQELLLHIATLAQRTPQQAADAARPERRAEAALRDLLTILNDELAQPVSVSDLAQRVGLSQNYLSRLFRQRLGMTVQRYVLTRRIEMARHLLSITNLPVGRIASRVGLPDPQHFNKQFRRLIGQSPTAVRLSERGDS